MARKHLHETGGSFGAKGTSRNAVTGAIESKPYVYSGSERVDDFVEKTIAQLRAKCQKDYPEGTVLIIRCVPDGMVDEPEWEAAMKRIKNSDFDVKFREVFLFEPYLNLSTTLTGRS